MCSQVHSLASSECKNTQLYGFVGHLFAKVDSNVKFIIQYFLLILWNFILLYQPSRLNLSLLIIKSVQLAFLQVFFEFSLFLSHSCTTYGKDTFFSY